MSGSTTPQPDTPRDVKSPPASDTEDDVFHDARFPAEEESRLLEESHSIKADANNLFSASCYDQAISCYDRALASCPNYLHYEVAVLRSNASACYLKLQDWKGAVDSATACIDCLERVIPSTDGKENGEDRPLQAQTQSKSTPDDAVVEIPDDAEDEQAELNRLRESDERKRNVLRIRAKALMRRARAKTELGGWGNLQGAEEDYKVLGSMDNLPVDDRKVVQKALRELPARINTAREKEMADMMGKLKDLGNGILKPFGLSTDNFQFTQDPKTGGYNMNFQSG